MVSTFQVVLSIMILLSKLDMKQHYLRDYECLFGNLEIAIIETKLIKLRSRY